MNSIREELKSDSLDLHDALEDCNEIVALLYRLDSLDKVNYPHEEDTLRKVIYRVNNFTNFGINATSYKSLVSSENISLITDLQLKEDLVSYYEFQGEIDFANQIFMQFLNESNDYLNDKFLFAEGRFTVTGILRQTEMRNNLTKLLSSIYQKKRKYLEAEERMNGLLKKLSPF